MNTRRLRTFAVLAPLGCLVGAFASGCSPDKGELEACYGFQLVPSITVHLVEPASSTGGMYTVEAPDWGLPSCEAFDGVVAGSTYTFGTVTLDERVQPDQCSLPVADVEGPGVGTVTTRREEVAESLLGATRQGRRLEYGPSAQAPDVGGCSGVWSLGTFPYGLVSTHDTDRHENEAWASGPVFDQLGAGDEAPVLIVRHFRLADGATCAALPLGVTECADVFSGYYAAAP